MSNEKIEVRLVLDANELPSPNVDVDSIVEAVVESYDFDNAVDRQINDRIESLESDIHTLKENTEDYDFDLMGDDLRRDEVAIDGLNKRVDELETLMLPEDSGDRMSMLILRVERLEKINERLLHVIHNVQGVDLP
tara:strand:- start:3904 stop:4311 length:408 start_codon:yes stop_codon:yes gene_type:complete